jgi:SUKH-3 immunity protein of toxin-antitoxin system
MKKLTALIRIALRSIMLGFAPQPPRSWEVSLEQVRQVEAEREKLGRQRLSTLSDVARKRFSELVLIKLLGNGWAEGRRTDADTLASLQQRALRPFPPSVTDLLSEFGGLMIHAGIGRCIDMEVGHKASTVNLSKPESVMGFHLHPVGVTNLFGDDGLMICADDSGRIFVDGETGCKRLGDRRIDYLAESFDRALEIMLHTTQTYDTWPGLPASGVWFYNTFEIRCPDDAVSGTLSATDWHERLQALSVARPGIEVNATLREKATQAGIDLRPPLPLDCVIEFEKNAGICLPDDYVFFITMIGNGSAGRGDLMSMEDWDAGYWSEAKLERDLIAPCLITPELEGLGEKWLDSLGVEDAEQKWDRDEWDPMRGSMTIAEIGCGLFFRMIVNGPHRGRIFVWGDHALLPPAFQSQLTFSSWIGHWLDAVAAGQSAPFLMG